MQHEQHKEWIKKREEAGYNEEPEAAEQAGQWWPCPYDDTEKPEFATRIIAEVEALERSAQEEAEARMEKAESAAEATSERAYAEVHESHRHDDDLVPAQDSGGGLRAALLKSTSREESREADQKTIEALDRNRKNMQTHYALPVV